MRAIQSWLAVEHADPVDNESTDSVAPETRDLGAVDVFGWDKAASDRCFLLEMGCVCADDAGCIFGQYLSVEK
jgi:hypothetical protein